MFERLSRKKKVSNPFANIASVVAARQEVLDIQEIGGCPVARGRLALFIECLSIEETVNYQTACRTFGQRTVKRFVMSNSVNSNVIDTLLNQEGVDDIALLTLATLRAQFAIYVNNLDAA